MALWRFLEAFVKRWKPKKILEIGGGQGQVSEWCPGAYVCVERNPTICEAGRKEQEGNHATFINDDFLHMDTRQFQGAHFGIVLAADANNSDTETESE